MRFIVIEKADKNGEVWNTQGECDDAEEALRRRDLLQKEFPDSMFIVEVVRDEEVS